MRIYYTEPWMISNEPEWRVGYHSWRVQYILIHPEIKPSSIIIIIQNEADSLIMIFVIRSSFNARGRCDVWMFGFRSYVCAHQKEDDNTFEVWWRLRAFRLAGIDYGIQTLLQSSYWWCTRWGVSKSDSRTWSQGTNICKTFVLVFFCFTLHYELVFCYIQSLHITMVFCHIRSFTIKVMKPKQLGLTVFFSSHIMDALYTIVICAESYVGLMMYLYVFPSWKSFVHVPLPARRNILPWLVLLEFG